MGQPITCAKCRRPFNAKFAKCPFCNADASDAAPRGAAFERLEPRRCGACQKPYNAKFAKCPFCNAPATDTDAPAPPPAAAGLPDWAALAERTIVGNRPLLALEFHPAAIAALDAFFDLTWGTDGHAKTNPNWTPNEAQNLVIVHFASFYGELYRREFGGHWEAKPEELLTARVVYANRRRYVVPIMKVFKRLLLGRAENFEQEYLGERLQLGVRGKPEEAEGWLRQAQHFKDVGRFDLVMAFCARGLAIGPRADTKMELISLGADAQRLEGKSS